MRYLTTEHLNELTPVPPLWMMVSPFLGIAGGFILGYFAAKFLGF
jgi:hypothetical protein